jgi:hypothetical protein
MEKKIEQNIVRRNDFGAHVGSRITTTARVHRIYRTTDIQRGGPPNRTRRRSTTGSTRRSSFPRARVIYSNSFGAFYLSNRVAFVRHENNDGGRRKKKLTDSMPRAHALQYAGTQ